MSLVWKEEEVRISIIDFGGGFVADELENNSVTLGIAAMKERMLLTGGQCAISSKIGEGTSVEISLPL
jgi:signal transduction histidine kinase